MSNVLAYYALHYGKDYLAASLDSIYEAVDKIVVLYTPQPSYGHSGSLPNPESEDELKACCGGKWDKVEWRSVWCGSEGQHRRVAEDLAETLEYDILLAVDADEIWDKQSLHEAIAYVEATNHRIYRVPFVHYWRTPDLVCTDPAQPHRFTKLSGAAANGDGYIPLSVPVQHYGYAISDELMAYKWSIHGHKAELRPEWMEEVWFGKNDAHPDGVHPTCRDQFWVPQPAKKSK